MNKSNYKQYLKKKDEEHEDLLVESVIPPTEYDVIEEIERLDAYYEHRVENRRGEFGLTSDETTI